MINFRILLLFLLLSCCFLYSSRRFFAHDAAISSPNSSLSFKVTPPLFQLLPQNLQTALHIPDQSERSEPYHGPRRTYLETSGHSHPAPPIQTNSGLSSALASTPASAPASSPVPTPVSNAHPPPTPLYLTLDQTDQLTRIEESLRSVGTQNMTLRLLFDSSSVGMMLATLPAATLLAPEDSAWANLANQEGGAEVQRLLDGPSGSLILHNLLLHHVLRQCLLYADFQVHGRRDTWQRFNNRDAANLRNACSSFPKNISTCVSFLATQKVSVSKPIVDIRLSRKHDIELSRGVCGCVDHSLP